MNHYPRHIGDYLRDTLGLTMIEDGAYNRLIDQYYAREGPLPADKPTLYRMARASTQVERDAVDSILRQFFVSGPDGWRSKRCEQELVLYRERSDKARKSANARWSDCNATPSNANAMRTHSDGNTSHKPVTSNQGNSKAMSSSPETANLDVVPIKVDRSNSERREAAREILGFLNAKTGRNYRLVDANLGPIMARMKEGATRRELRAVIARKCREWGSDEKMMQYLRPATLFNATKFNQYVGEVPPAEMEATDVPSLS